MDQVKEIIQKNRVALCEQIDFETLLWEQLIQDKVISPEQKENIKVRSYCHSICIIIEKII